MPKKKNNDTIQKNKRDQRKQGVSNESIKGCK